MSLTVKLCFKQFAAPNFWTIKVKRLFVEADQMIFSCMCPHVFSCWSYNWMFCCNHHICSKTLLPDYHSYLSKGKRKDSQCQPPPPFLLGGQLLVPNFEKGGGQKKMSAWGDLKRSCHGYLPGGRGAHYVYCQKRLKNKIWLWGLNFKCWSWPVLAKQPINV